MKSYQSTILLAASLVFVVDLVAGFSNPSQPLRGDNNGLALTTMGATTVPESDGCGFEASSMISSSSSSRRQWFQQCSKAATAVTVMATMGAPFVASAADETALQKIFAPGGTLVDYKVGVGVGNDGASKSRRSDNSNVVFGQDYYYKFGTAPQFIPKGDTSFPVKIPFVLSQQRYDNMKKYRERVQRGIDLIASLKSDIEAGKFASITAADAPEYSIRPFGLLANGFLASENTGTTNELFLARWYINEIYLDIDDIKNASSEAEALKSYSNAIKALNSLLGMLNRSITSKVGDPFDLL